MFFWSGKEKHKEGGFVPPPVEEQSEEAKKIIDRMRSHPEEWGYEFFAGSLILKHKDLGWIGTCDPLFNHYTTFREYGLRDADVIELFTLYRDYLRELDKEEEKQHKARMQEVIASWEE